MSIYRPLVSPITSSLPADFPQWTYVSTEVRLEKLNLSENWRSVSCCPVVEWDFIPSEYMVNTMPGGRRFFGDLSNVDGDYVILNPDSNQIRVRVSPAGDVTVFSMPAGTIVADKRSILRVEFDFAKLEIRVSLNEWSETKTNVTALQGHRLDADALTWGGVTSKIQAKMIRAALTEPKQAVVNRWVTNGDNDGYITVPEIELQDFDIEFTTKRLDTPYALGTRYLGHSDGTDFIKWFDSTVSDTMRITIGGSSFDTVVVIPQGQIVKIRVTRIGSQVTLFVDDVQAGTKAQNSLPFNISEFLRGGGTDYTSTWMVDVSINGERFYAIDEPSGNTVIDSISGQHGTRVNMESSNFEFVKSNDQVWEFGELTPSSSNILKPVRGDIDLEITNFDPAGVEPL